MRHPNYHYRTLIGLGLGLAISLSANLIRPPQIQAPTVATSYAQRVRRLLQNYRVNGLVLYGTAGHSPTIIAHRTVAARSTAVLQPDRYFPLASLTKLLTGLAVERLQQTRSLPLTTPLSTYFPTVAHAQQITLFRLLTHTSGLSDTTSQTPRLETRLAAQFNFANQHFRSTGRYQWNYANIDYVLLAQIIGRVSGQTYPTYVQQHVLQPWGITQIKPFTAVSPHQIVPATPWRPWNTWSQLARRLSATPGAGDYVATPRAAWQLIGRVLTTPTVAQWFTQAATTSPSHYFGGLYLHGSLWHANGGYPSYAIIVYGDVRTHRLLMLVTNNLNLTTAKRLRDLLIRPYFT